MSTDKQVYPLYYEAKNDKVRKRLGIKGGFYWAEAKKLSIAISRGAVAIDDAGYDEDDFKKPVRVNLPVVDDLPPEGVFDTEFCNRYEKGGEDGITMVFIAPSSSAQDKPASTDNTNVNGEDMTEIEENMLLPISGQELPIRWLAQHGSEKPVTHVSRDELRALHNAQEEKLPAVTALAISNKAAQLEPLEIRDLHKLVRDTDKVFPNPGNSDLGLMTAFFEAYLGADYTDRGLLTKEWMKGNRVSRITRTASGANAGGGNKTDRNPNLVHTFDTLDVEIAAATLPMDFNIYEIPGSVYRRAKEVVRKKESPFKEWSAALRAIPGILDYSRAAIFALIRSAHPEFYHYPGRLQGYINAYLTETDHENPTEETLAAARHTPEKDILEEVNRELAAERETEEEKNNEEKSQPSDAMADEQATTEAMEQDTTEHRQDTQSLDAQSQVNSVDAKYQKLRAELHEARKTIPPKNPVDADKLLAASRGEFVEGISDPNDPKWVKGIETRDSVNQNQQESEQNDQKAEQNSPNALQNEPETKQPEPVAQQEVEKVCNACGQSGGDNCPDCGAVMGDATYQETFDDENQVEVRENEPEKMEGAEHPHNENADSDPHRNCSDETGEASAPVATEIMWPSYFEPGRYENLPNEVYHSANGISSTMLKDARISLMYYHGRHIAGTIPNEESDALLRGRIIHSYVLETDKFADEYAIPVPVPEYVVTTSNELIAIIKKHNASLPALMTPEQMKEWIESYNSTLIQPLSVSAGAEETGILYGSLPVEFRRIPEGEKHTASAMKACIKEYNASLPPLLKTSGAREQLLDQIETVDPELAKKERAKSLPYNISGTKEQLTEIARKIRPELVTLEDWQKRQQEENAGKTFISPDMYEQAKNIHAALQNNTDAARLLNHPDRKSEISYFGFDEETGLEIRVRPDIEIRLPYESICADVKSVSLGYVRQERLKDRLHREIIERDYHLSAAMYCDVANLDKFFWIFVNKDAGYHWVAVVEASQELLELGRQEYRRTLHQINEALETNNWPAPITESYTDELNDFDLRRLEALSI
ncbi:TPA: exodeoxyribonuclease VIII [Escherichia coli]|uniref:exodeoxyribonuclease VIII n=6 Tax=Escherichia TaxID=561 RepID=UPI0019888DD1|nr:exodeoxyribonuclease VIII [Escherichia coli]EBB4754388.1 exodeoxyribonuclease VIII [Salmonella enterica subsp. enterica serovar Typhimurium]EFN4899564.1 exodeoxyribonuclease VIII [Escherichia coli]EGD6905774.1 exodeoxyribonuclease VIII [Escherichia coli]EGL9779444.1 exodeoxyribonuclease VIII [Escherichia coli]EHU7545360.1 exodeoxyribonuclease VIII [Escherichia coli]